MTQSGTLTRRSVMNGHGAEGMEGKEEGQLELWQPHKSSSLRKVKWKSSEASLWDYDVLRCLSPCPQQVHLTARDPLQSHRVSWDPSRGVRANQLPAWRQNCNSFLPLSDSTLTSTEETVPFKNDRSVYIYFTTGGFQGCWVLGLQETEFFGESSLCKAFPGWCRSSLEFILVIR